MTACIAESLDHQVGTPVDDLGKVEETGGTAHVTAQAYTAHAPTPVTVDRRVDLREEVEPADACGGLRLR